MVDKNFIGLDKPDITRFESYLPTAFSSELTLLQKVNKIIQDLNRSFDLTNEMVDYLNRFIETFDEKLYETIEDVLTVWLEDGRLADIVRVAINEEVIEARTPFEAEAYKTLGERLDKQIGINTDFRGFEKISFMRRIYNEVSERGINVKSFGVDNSGNVDVTAQLNTILTEFGGGKIFFPDGIYQITNSLILYDNTTIELANNAVIKFKEHALPIRENPNIYAAKHIFKNHPTLGTKNIEVFGGVIDGSARTQARDVHKGFYLENIDNIKIHDMKIKEVSGWGIAHINCRNFHFYNIVFDQAPESGFGYNGDGITGMSSDGLIENISGYTSDDLVSLQAGNTLFRPQTNIRNVTVRGLYPHKKTWVNGQGELITEVTHRPLGLYAYDGYLLDNVIVDNIQGVTAHDLLITTPYFNVGGVKGRIGNLKITNVDIEVDGVEGMVYQIKNINVGNISFINVSFKNIDGVRPKNAFYIENASIKHLLLDNFYCNKITGDQPFLLDKGEIEKITIVNSYFNNDSISSSGYIYYKDSVSSNTTILDYTSITSNVGAFVGSKSNENKIRVIRGDYRTQETFITSPQLGDLVRLNDKGSSVFKDNRFSPLGDSFKYVGISSASFTINDVYSLVAILGGVTTCTIKFGENIEKFSWAFEMSVPSGVNLTFQDGKNNQIFTTATFNEGVYKIARTGMSWVYVKISDNRYLS